MKKLQWGLGRAAKKRKIFFPVAHNGLCWIRQVQKALMKCGQRDKTQEIHVLIQMPQSPYCEEPTNN